MSAVQTHFVHDSATQERERVIGPQRSHQAQVDEWIKEEESRCVFVDSMDFNPANFDQQLGKSYTSTELEARLAKILPLNVVFIDNPYNPTKKAVVRIVNGVQETLCAYERGFMPEHSVFTTRTEDIRDLSVRHIERADLPKHEIVPGIGVVWEPGAKKPGEKRITQIWNESIRGWRTVLIRLLEAKVVDLPSVERIFTIDNRPQWAAHTGRQELHLPF